MAPAETTGELRIEVVYCPRPGVTDLVTVQLPAGATVADALRASSLSQRHALQTDDLRIGVWSRVVDPATPLRDRDRVEIYRPLKVDPKEARRQRYKQHKERQSGA